MPRALCCLLVIPLCSTAACFETAPNVEPSPGTSGGTSTSSASSTGNSGASSSTSPIGETGDTTSDATTGALPCLAPMTCVPAVPDPWHGPHVLVDASQSCPGSTSANQRVSFDPPVCGCDCTGCINQSVTLFGPDACDSEILLLSPLGVGECNQPMSPDALHVIPNPPTSADFACAPAVEQKLQWCDTTACEGGLCLPAAVGEAPFGACIWCEGDADACGACPGGFPHQLALRDGDQGELACECCGALSAQKVCNGMRDGCDPGAPLLELGACSPLTTSEVAYRPRPGACGADQPASGNAFTACCEHAAP